MSLALIGHTGFVGSTLKRQTAFDHLFNSSNIQDIDSNTYDTVICSAAPAQKWIANREPEADWANIQKLIGSLEKVKCRHFILISTVDVFASPIAVDESTVVQTEGLHPYGLHRRRLEEFVESRFASRLIVRLPGLVGPGLRKNILFDFHNDNNVSAIDSRSRFQFYPMVNLYGDLIAAEKAQIDLLHLTSVPVSVAEVAREAFGVAFDHAPETLPALYDMRSQHALDGAGAPGYQYDRRATLTAIRAYHQSEPRKAALE
ncbi:NAD(P)-dependent oxidoreductase [Stenotrophomonas maltophilia]|uniref:NAD(P)-dependent oxidoreductase n=1 Tax=Stenotrophomonas TaxID=40323 RepID=UPI0012B47EFB|nr:MULTISPECIES: NAD(P)-dependent oxidoreductase [Stenotrophomonas]MCI1137564.1 NAD(P)-dependent oxidoreductase [Stenotrophomonas maltophilia]MDQ7311415.1 NAD(P)-dependent oxidoreductase [Stenotrophomonas sp. Sm10]QGL87258.1 NAD(P)-dependent oxidoreductase [Stenotrophomonas maltophilia]